MASSPARIYVYLVLAWSWLPYQAAFATCPSSAITGSTSHVYGYVTTPASGGTSCTFKTLEEAESFAKANNGSSGPALALAFPIIGSMDLPGSAGELDYRPNGANDTSSAILTVAPTVVSSTYTAAAKNWPPTSTLCQTNCSAGGSCSTMAAELTRMQCYFDSTYSNTTAHPEYCFSRVSGPTLSGTPTRLKGVTGVGSSSGIVTYGPTSNTSNDSGASVSITGNVCGSNTSSVIDANGRLVVEDAESSAAIGTHSNQVQSTQLSVTWGMSQQNNVTCASGATLAGDGTCNFAWQKVFINPPSIQETTGQCGVGNPCFPSNGNKEVVEKGFQYGEMSFNLFYNSLRQTRPYAYIDGNWSHTFAKRILTEWAGPVHIESPDSNGDVVRMAVQDEEAHVETYVELGAGTGVYRSTNSVGRVLKWTPSSGGSDPFWTLYFPDGSINKFDRAGRLSQIINPDDPRKTLTLTYLASFTWTGSPHGPTTDSAHYNEPFWRLARVTDGTGRYISFQYSADIYYWLTSIVADDGTTTLMSFGYSNSDNVHRLTQATQFGQSRTYIYNEPANIGTPPGVTAYWLTGIVDELGQRFATYQYDDWGRSIASWHGSSTDKAGIVTITYPQDGSGNPVDGQASVTLPLGGAVTYNFPSSEPYRSAQSIADSSGTSSSYVYDDQGTSPSYRLLQRTDHNGNVTKYEYDANAVHISAMTEGFNTAQQRRTEYDWDASSNRIRTTRVYSDPPAGPRTLESQTTNTFDSGSGAQITAQIKDPGTGTSRIWTRSYCQQAQVPSQCPIAGLLTSVDGPRTDVADVVTLSYYSSTDLSGCATVGMPCHRLGDLHTQSNALSQTFNFVTYDRAGRPTRTTDKNGIITDLSYFPRGWLQTRVIHYNNSDGSPAPGNESYTYDYYAPGYLKKATRTQGDFYQYSYDTAGRVTDLSDNSGASLHYQYDSANNRILSEILDAQGNVTRKSTKSYNSLNHLRTSSDGYGRAQQTFQNPPSGDALPPGITVTDGYDGSGNPTYVLNGLGVANEIFYDALNRPSVQKSDHTGISPSTKDATVSYSYDARNHLVNVTDPDSVQTHYAYNGFGNLVTLTSADTGSATFSYNEAGEQSSSLDARGVSTTYSYDVLNRLVGISYPTTSLNETFEYDQSHTNSVCTVSDPVGWLTQFTDASGSTTYCYGPYKNLRTKVQITSGIALQTAYSWNSDHFVTGVTYPSGAQLTLVRDSTNRAISATYKAAGASNAVTLLSSISYYPMGSANAYTFGSGHVLTKTYDANYNIDSVASSVASAQTLDFSLDNVGNMSAVSSTLGGTPNQTYTYDPLQRLTTMGTVASFSYSPAGDRLTKTATDGPHTYTYSPLSHRLATVDGVARSYDNNGNTTFMSGVSFTYNDKNRMASAGSVSYKYNAKGERVFKSSPATLYTYDEEGNLLGEYSTTGTAQIEYLYVDQTLVGVVTGGTLYYVDTDHVGTPRSIILPAAGSNPDSLVWKWSYLSNAFGGATPSPQTITMNLRYPGQYFDSESGLFHNGARDYEPASGRYVESDPLGLGGGAFSTYSYAGGNALSNYDPLGLYCTSKNSNTHCSYPDGPDFDFPTPAGWEDFAGDELLYHAYDVTRNIGCASAVGVENSMINHPTPSPNARPATYEGTVGNDASVAGLENYVTTYLTTDHNTGNLLVINVTAGPGSVFSPGYVAREVRDGVAHTWGEGLNYKQADALWWGWPLGLEWIPNWLINQGVWGTQMSDFINQNRCDCK